MRALWLLAGLTLFLPPLIWADPVPQQKDPDVGKAYGVPFRVTDSGHLMVRVKINGKGPFNFIVDTGAPLVYVTLPAAKKAGLPTEKKEIVTAEKFQIEGGPVHTQLKCLPETPFQLEGMNALGMAGVELHGILGYTLLAQYKLEIDLTKDRMTWTKLDFMPPAPVSIGKENAPEGLDSLGKFMKLLAVLMDKKGIQEPQLRGFVGVELVEKNRGVVVQAVLDKSPAAAAGLKVGDRIDMVEGKAVAALQDLRQILAILKAGQQITFTVLRGEARHDIKITAGEGL
jgi:hypothetical protein